MEKMLNEGNQIHSWVYCAFVKTFVITFYYDFLTSYGSSSGSTRQKVTVPIPPQ
jgi:hypothetical protein